MLPPEGVLGLGSPLLIGVLALPTGLAEPDCWLGGGPDGGMFCATEVASCAI